MRSGIILVISLFLISCVKEEFHEDKFNGTLDLTPGVAIPVGFSHLEIEKYLRDSTFTQLRISDDGFLTLYYSSDVFSESMNDLLTISPVSETSTLLNQTGAPISLSLPGASLLINDTILIPFNTDQDAVRIDSIKLLTGTLQMNIAAANVTGSVTFSFPGVLQTGNSFNVTCPFSNPGFTQDLTGFTIIPEQDVAGDHFIRCLLSVLLQNPSGPISNGDPVFDITTDISSIVFETAYGDFSGLSGNVPPAHFDIRLFDHVSSGNVYLADPQVTVNFNNSCGVPIAVSFSQLEITDRNNTSHAAAGPGVPTITNQKVINYPRLNEEGSSVSDSVVLDRNNSNIRDLLASNPVAMDVAGTGSIVPAAGNSTTFIRHDSELEISAAIKIPLEGKAEFLILLDTIPFDYLETALPVPEEIERLIVQLNIINCFPVSVKPQVYLLDENRILIDSLLNGREMIEGASDENGDGKADPLVLDPVYIDLPREKIDRMTRTRYLVTRGELTTTNYPAEDVRLYSSYFLDYRVGLIAQLRINTGKL